MKKFSYFLISVCFICIAAFFFNAYVPLQYTQDYDVVTNMYESIDRFRNIRTAETKRIVGSNFGSTIDTAGLYTITNTNGGTTTANTGVCSLATNTTANGATQIVTKGKIRYLSGRSNLFRAVVRFSNTGSANNVRQFGILVDTANLFVFRLSGTTFSVVAKRASVETVVASGSFNGNGTSSGGTWTVDTNFHAFEIMYTTSRIGFTIDNQPIHTFSATNNSTISSMVGSMYAANINSGGSTTSNYLNLLTWSGSQIGDAINNPQFYNINAVAETRTLKAGGGTLQSISIGRSGGNGATLTLYDNTAGSGTIIGIWDLNNVSSVGTHTLGIEGVNFNNGLTYVTSGTMTSASATIFWE